MQITKAKFNNLLREYACSVIFDYFNAKEFTEGIRRAIEVLFGKITYQEINPYRHWKRYAFSISNKLVLVASVSDNASIRYDWKR